MGAMVVVPPVGSGAVFEVSEDVAKGDEDVGRTSSGVERSQ